MTMGRRAAFFAGLLALFIADGASSQVPVGARLQLAGSSTMAPLVRAIAKRFQELHLGVEIVVREGGSGRGIAEVRNGTADIGMASHALGESEDDLTGFPIARDGVALVVHRNNPVSALSDAQAADIFRGRVTNWRQVGGRDAPFKLVKAEAGRSSSEIVARHFGLPYDDIKAWRVVGANAERIQLLAENPDAMIYMSIGETERAASQGVPVKALILGGVAASTKAIRNGDYPLSRALTLVTRGMPKGVAKDFVEFALSSSVTGLVKTHDFVPYLD